MPAFQPTHVCVWPDGDFCAKQSLHTRTETHPPHLCATVKLRPGEMLIDAAHRHLKAEKRYFATL